MVSFFFVGWPKALPGFYERFVSLKPPRKLCSNALLVFEQKKRVSDTLVRCLLAGEMGQIKYLIQQLPYLLPSLVDGMEDEGLSLRASSL